MIIERSYIENGSTVPKGPFLNIEFDKKVQEEQKESPNIEVEEQK